MPARLRRVVAALLALGVLGGGPLPTRAVDETPPVALPAEPPAQSLPGPTYDAVTADLDGDGTFELVRLTTDRNGAGGMGIETWSQPFGSAAMLVGQASIRRDASVEEALTARPRPAPDNTLPLGVNDAGRLLVMRDGEARRVVLAAIGAGDDGARPCCLTLYEVRWALRTPMVLARLGGVQQDADAVLPVDLDGDGTDELVAIEGQDDDGELPVRVYHVFGDRLQTDVVTLEVATVDAANAVVGETDGRPGDELLFTATRVESGEAAQTLVARIAIGPDGLQAETAVARSPAIPAILPRSGMPFIVLMSTLDDSMEADTWPSGGQLRVESQVGLAGTPFGLVGEGGDSRLLIRSRDDRTVLVIDGNLDRGTPIGGSRSADRFATEGLAAYAGVWPGGLDGSDAFVFRGQLIQRDGRSRPIASLVGAQPMGVMGPAALTTVLRFGSGLARLDDPLLVGGGGAAGSLELAPTSAVLRPEPEGESLSIGLRGAVIAPDQVPTLLVPSARFDVLVDAPAGSRVLTALDAEPAFDPSIVIAQGFTTAEVPITMTANAAELAVVVLTPAGAAYRADWHVERRVGPPVLLLDVPVAPLSASVPIAGSTDPGATVTVNDRIAEVDAEGRFAANISAGLTPTSVTVEVVDLVGNRATETLSVVGWVDYRRLPWIPIISLMTIVAGALLWLRVPRPRRWARRGADDDARLEEIDA